MKREYFQCEVSCTLSTLQVDFTNFSTLIISVNILKTSVATSERLNSLSTVHFIYIIGVIETSILILMLRYLEIQLKSNQSL